MNPTDGSPSGAPLAIPGLVYVAPTDDLHPATVEIDPAAGFRRPRGIRQWSHEASVARVADLGEAARKELGLTLPHEQIDATKFPHAHRAAKSNPVVAVPHELVAQLVGKGVRVHTVGFDKITSGFFYLAEGGGEELRVQGDLIEMLGPILQYGSANEDIERHLGRVVDRMLSALSGGAVNELRVELADALPTLAPKGAASSVDLAAFEDEARQLAEPTKKWEPRAKELVAALEGAIGRKEPTLAVPLYGEARRVTRAEMELDVRGKRIVLPSRVEWVVSGQPSDVARATKAAAAPVTSQVDEAWGEDEDATVKPAAAAAKPTPSPASAKVSPAPTPSPIAAKATPASSTAKATPAPTPSPIAAKVTPSPTAKVTPALASSPSAAKATPSPSTARVTPAPTPSPIAAKTAPTPAKTGPLAARLMTPPPVVTKPAASAAEPAAASSGSSPAAASAASPAAPAVSAVVATRITAVSGAGAAPEPAVAAASKPRVEPPVVRAGAAAVAPPAVVVEPPAADDDDDDEAEAPAERKSGKKLSKKERKAQKAAERRAAAEAANRAANSPKAKSVAPRAEPAAETKPAPAPRPADKSERPKAAAAVAKGKSVAPAAKKAPSAPPAVEPPGSSSFGTITLVLLVLLALAAAGWWFFLRHK